MAFRIRLSPSGPPIEGQDDGDILIWNATTNLWDTGPQGGGPIILAGDANGQSDLNIVTSLSPDIGGVNIPLGDFTSDPVEIRIVVRSPAGGDIDTVSLATLAAALPTFTTEYDFIITSRADLETAVGPPVGGVFTLLTGSYAFKTAFALNAGERITNGGNSVLIKGVGPTKVLSGDTLTAPLFTVTGGTVQLDTFSLDSATDGQPALLQSGGIITAYDCSFQGGSLSDGVQLTGGEWHSTDGEYAGGVTGLRQSGASATQLCRMKGGRFNGAFTEACFRAEGAGNTIEAQITDVDMSNSVQAAQTVLLNGATSGDFYFRGCRLRHTVDNHQTIAQVTDVSTAVFEGNNIFSEAPTTPGDGIQFSGTIGGGTVIEANTFLDLDDAIREANLTDIERASIGNNDFGGSISVGINWDAADMPNDGMLIEGNGFGGATTPFNGFSEVTARVNAKCNSQNGSLLPETPIVP